MFKLGLAQCCHPADGDVLAMVDAWMTRANEAGVDLLVFPESLMVPFDSTPEEFSRQAEPLDGPFCTGVNALAAKHGLWTVYTANERNRGRASRTTLSEQIGHAGFNGEGNERNERSEREWPHDKGNMSVARVRPFNTAIVVDDAGDMRAVYRKVHLFDTDFVHESDKITPGSELMQPVETPFGKIGVGICYDLRFPELARAAALAGADVIVYPAAWVDGPRKVEQWRTLLAARAIENELFVAGLSRCDRAFGASGRDYAGHSCVFGPLGEELASAGLGEELLVADIDVSAIARARAAMPVLDHRRTNVY